MKSLKKMTALFLSVILALAMSGNAFAAINDTGYSDVAADAWYADAVVEAREKGWMNGTSNTAFSPDTRISRGQITAILYRASGSPSVSDGTVFSDVSSSAYYSDAIVWASANGVVSGYPDGSFAPDASITRQEMATILWRYADSPAAEQGEDFTDESGIASYASTAVDWARANGIITGMEGNMFDPNGVATRAQAAVILSRYMKLVGNTRPEPDPSDSRTLVVYFSATGSTESVAETIAGTRSGDLFELVPVSPYTSEDLNWTVPGSRVNQEHENPALQDVKLVQNTVENWEEYDTVFVGYPIWWGIAAWPVNDFIQNNDFSGKTVIPFCTSTSSGLGQSAVLLEEMAGSGNWLEGHRFSSRTSEAEVQAWVNGLGA